LDLGRLVASSCRQKIMATLASVGQTHMMDLVRKVNSTYTQVDRNLKILQKENIVEIRYYGRLRMIKLNRENPKTEVIIKALRMLKHQQLHNVRYPVLNK
jgi:DNA-binding transcriptional ArsR family regulator